MLEIRMAGLLWDVGPTCLAGAVTHDRVTRVSVFICVLFAATTTFGADWQYWASLDGYFTPDKNYSTATLMADRDALHLEGRYNYEGQNSGSAWIGWTVHRDAWRITPMIGAVAGHTRGIAPGVEVTAAWKKLDFYTEGEYLFASGSDDFAYFWSELAYSPIDWLRAGIAAQRTRAFDTGVDIQRGLLVGFRLRKATLTTTLFEPGSENQTVVVTAAIEF